jgi:hypothetical protein
MALSLYNTLSKAKEPFQPLVGNQVRMYVCGMTVYDFCHIGHARVMVAFDVIARWLRQRGYELTYVRNITDIDDKIIRRAQENGEPFDALTERMIAAMHEDEARLSVLRPDIEPRATGHIAGMHADRQGFRLRSGQWRRLLPRRQVRRLRQAVAQEDRRPAHRRAHRGRRIQGRPAGLRAVEGGQAGRAELGIALGRRAPGLAHRMLGDVHLLPGRDLRHPRRRP